MKKTSGNALFYAACLAAGISVFSFFGCAGTGEETQEVKVTFVQNNEKKAEISVASGGKIDVKNVKVPESERENCVTEWNFDFDLPVTGNKTVGTISYTTGLNFSKSLKEESYLITGYTGNAADVFMPDDYKGSPVTAIRADSFKENESIVSVRFPSALVSVGDYAFKGCHSLETAKLPETVTSLGASAFAECAALTSFTIPAKVTKIPARLAQGHTYDSIVVPEGVSVIEPYAFASKITKIVLPVTLKRIEYVGIWANLRQIFYAGEEYRWEAVELSDEPYTGTGGVTFSAKSIASEIAVVYFYSDKQPEKPGNYWHYVSGEPAIWEQA